MIATISTFRVVTRWSRLADSGGSPAQSIPRVLTVLANGAVTLPTGLFEPVATTFSGGRRLTRRLVSRSVSRHLQLVQYRAPIYFNTCQCHPHSKPLAHVHMPPPRAFPGLVERTGLINHALRITHHAPLADLPLPALPCDASTRHPLQLHRLVRHGQTRAAVEPAALVHPVSSSSSAGLAGWSSDGPRQSRGRTRVGGLLRPFVPHDWSLSLQRLRRRGEPVEVQVHVGAIPVAHIISKGVG